MSRYHKILSLVILAFTSLSALAQDKPNILVIWGDDIGSQGALRGDLDRMQSVFSMPRGAPWESMSSTSPNRKRIPTLPT